MNRRTCFLLLLLTAALWSTGGVIIKSVDWNPGAIAAARSLAAMLTIAFLARKEIDLAAPTRTERLGAVFLALLALLFVTATKLTTAANAILLQYTAPIWVAIAAPLVLRERTSGRDWLFIGLVLFGMTLFFKDSLSYEGLWGIAAAIGSSIFFGGLAVLLRVAKDGKPMKITIYGNMLLALTAVFFWRPPWPSAGEWGLMILAGMVQFGLPYYLYTLASKGVSSLEMVLVTTLEPILNPIWVFLLVGEKPGLWSLVGGGVVLITVTAWSIMKIPPSARGGGGSGRRPAAEIKAEEDSETSPAPSA